jgi:hypothetical protein
MENDRKDTRDRNDEDAQDVVGSEGGAAAWGGSSRVNKEEGAPAERSAGDDTEPVSRPRKRPEKI